MPDLAHKAFNSGYRFFQYFHAGCEGESQVTVGAKGCATDTDFSAMILNEAEVALVPGSAFGADGYLRFSFATSMEKLEEAVARIKRFMG